MSLLFASSCASNGLMGLDDLQEELEGLEEPEDDMSDWQCLRA